MLRQLRLYIHRSIIVITHYLWIDSYSKKAAAAPLKRSNSDCASISISLSLAASALSSIDQSLNRQHYLRIDDRSIFMADYRHTLSLNRPSIATTWRRISWAMIERWRWRRTLDSQLSLSNRKTRRRNSSSLHQAGRVLQSSLYCLYENTYTYCVYFSTPASFSGNILITRPFISVVLATHVIWHN